MELPEINNEIDITIVTNGKRKINALVLNRTLKKVTTFLQDKVNQILQYNTFKPIHQWNGTKLRLQNPDGTYGMEVDLKGIPNALGVVVGKNVFNRNGANFQQNKGLRTTTDAATVAQIIDVTGFIISDYLPVVAGQQYTFSNYGTNKAIQFADANKVRLSGIWFQNTTPVTITVPSGCSYLLFTIKSSSESEIPAQYQIELGTLATSYEAYTSVVETIDSLPFKAERLKDGATIQTVSAGPKAVVNRETMTTGIQAALPAFAKYTSRNAFNRNSSLIQVNKAVINYNTTGTIVTLQDWWVSDYIPVVAGEQWTFSGQGNSKAVQFSDANKSNLGGQVLGNGVPTTVTIPVNCYFICFNIKSNSEATIPVNYQVEKGAVATGYLEFFEHVEKVNAVSLIPWFHPTTTGKNLLIIGDSIFTTKPQSGGTQIEWPTFIKTPYWGQVFTAATNGARIKDDASESATSRTILSYQIQYSIDQGWQPDVILIGLGTNDFFAPNWGSYAAAMAKTTIESLDRTLLYEALRYAYWKITLQWPNARVFHATPLQRPDRTLEAAQAVSAAIRQMAPNYCVRVIDAEAESGVVRQFENVGAAGRLLRDGLHPNDTGKPLLAAYYMRKIIASIA